MYKIKRAVVKYPGIILGSPIPIVQNSFLLSRQADYEEISRIEGINPGETLPCGSAWQYFRNSAKKTNMLFVKSEIGASRKMARSR